MTRVLIIGAGGQIPRYLIPLLQAQTAITVTLFGRHADALPYDGLRKITGQADQLSDLVEAMQGQDIVYMNFDDKAITELVITAMHQTGIRRIIQARVLSVYGEVAEPFAAWNTRMMGGAVAKGRGIEALEASDLDYVYLRMTWLYNGQGREYVASPKGAPFLGAQVTRKAIAQFVLDTLTGKREYHRASIGLWEPGSEYKTKPDFY
ncbi:NAD(P)H-binding protein [Enterococcus sp.]|uniref:NAD(P)H-binding protein n=1 Tax=Enterococcus sp. TaxID=35783 RepID=UPI0028A9F1B8|nr:NAD(P)H-binding protein [Enterococcus sp.]